MMRLDTVGVKTTQTQTTISELGSLDKPVIFKSSLHSVKSLSPVVKPTVKEKLSVNM